MRSFHRAALLIAGLFPGTVMAGAALAAPKPLLPESDPPVVVGEAYAIDGATITPADAPFDDVGLATLDTEAGDGPNITMAHRTLPLPSYAEVTALDTGRTILVRIERRGPLSGPAFVALSSSAFAQLGADTAAPLGVRVRRVTPQAYERSLLRTGQRAPERLATPKSLLQVLRSRLAAKLPQSAITTQSPSRVVEPVDLPPSESAPVSKPVAAVAPAPKVAAAPPKPPVTKPAVAKTPGIKPAGTFAVQVASFANRAGADATAKRLGGSVNPAGKLWRVRLGPFATRAEAGAAQTKARKAGFADAQVVPGK